MNNLTSKLNSEYFNIYYGLLAYYNVATPPKFRLNNNVIPFIAYERIRWDNNNFDFKNSIEWSKVSNNLGWYDYTYGYNYLIPRIYNKTINNYLRWAIKNNIKHYYTEAYPNWAEGPKYWILAKLLWEPNQDVQKLEEEWYIKFCGKESAVFLKKFYNIWEDYWTISIHKSNWYNEKTTFLPFNDLRYMSLINQSMVIDSELALINALKFAKGKDKERLLMVYKMWGLYKVCIEEFIKGNIQYSKDLKKSNKIINKLKSLVNDDIHHNTIKYILNNSNG